MTAPTQPEWLYPISLERAVDLAEGVGLSQYSTTILPHPFAAFVFDETVDAVFFRLRFGETTHVLPEFDVGAVAICIDECAQADIWLKEHCGGSYSLVEFSLVTFGSTQDRVNFEAAL